MGECKISTKNSWAGQKQPNLLPSDKKKEEWSVSFLLFVNSGAASCPVIGSVAASTSTHRRKEMTSKQRFTSVCA